MTCDVLVTGGAGFIGSHVVGALLERGYRVLCLDNFCDYYDPQLKRNNIFVYEQMEGFKLAEGDVRDKALLARVFEENAFRFVIHEAAQAGVRYSLEHPLEVMDVNINGTLNLLGLAIKHQIEKFVNISSSSVYGVVKYLPFDEVHPTVPISPYGVSKLAAEHYTRVLIERHGIKTVSLRYFTVFGPRMRPDLAISIFTRKCLAGEDIEIFGSGQKTRDFTYIENIIDGTLKAMEKGTGEYNLGGGERLSVLDLANRIKELTGADVDIVYSADAEGDMEHTQSNIEKAKKELDYEVKVSLDEGLERYIEWAGEGSRR